jgi:hypothetical protein
MQLFSNLRHLEAELTIWLVVKSLLPGCKIRCIPPHTGWFFCVYLHSFGVLNRCLGVDLKILLTSYNYGIYH